MDAATAAQACQALDMHVVEINSTAELDQVRTLFPTAGSFWLDAQHTGSRWTSSNGCPLVFAWEGGQPDLPGTVRCAIQQSTGASTTGCDQQATVICEKNT